MTEIFKTPTLPIVEGALKIVEQARKDGKEGRPSQGDTALTQTEETIKSYFVTEEIEKTYQLAQQAINSGHIERSEMLAGEPVGRIRILASKLAEKIESLRDQDEGGLIAAYKARLRAEADSNYFQAANELRHDADYPTSSIMHYVIIGFIVFGETILNGFFFAQGMTGGLVGGFIAALLITLVNVVAAYVVGTYCARQKNHVDVGKKIFGWGTLFIYAVFLVWFCVAVGHYRSLIQINNDALEAARQIMDVIFSWEIFEIKEFYGWLLVFFSFLIGVITTIKFYKADDVYPGYGRITRTLKSRVQNYEKEKSAHRTKVDLQIHESQEDLFNLKKKTRDHVKQYQTSIKKSNQIIDGYETYLESIQGVYGQAIKNYRKNNIEIRATAPPAYFENIERIEPNHMPTLDREQYNEDVEKLPDIEATLDELPDAFDDASDKLASFRENSQSDFKAYLSSLEKNA